MSTVPLLRLSRERCEQAFAQYVAEKLAGLTDPPESLQNLPVFVRKGQYDSTDGTYTLDNPDEIPLPAICFGAPRVRPHEVMNYAIVELHVIVMSQVDEKDVMTRASERVGFVCELLDATNFAALETALNPPGGTDNRVVKDFTVWGLVPTQEQGQETDRHWMDHLTYEVHCVPVDNTLPES